MRAMIVNHNSIESDHGKIVPWWSFGKTVLSATVYKLMEQKRLNLDTCYLGLKGSLRQLLRHEAGLKDYYSSKEYHNAVSRNYDPWTFEKMIEIVQGDKLLFEPGKGWMYSNIGYAYIRKIIEMETQKSLEESIKELIFEPINIYDVKVANRPEDIVECINITKNYHPGWLYHGLLIGKLKYAVQFLDALAEGKIISPETFEQMSNPFNLKFDIGDRPWKKPAYAHGLMVDNRTDMLRSFGHTGVGPGSTIAVYHFPNGKNKVTVASSIAEKEQAVTEYEVFNAAKNKINI